MTKQVGFLVVYRYLVETKEPAMVKKLQEFVKTREFEYLKLEQPSGEVVYARLDMIPTFTFRDLSSITNLEGQPLALVGGDTENEQSSPSVSTDSNTNSG